MSGPPALKQTQLAGQVGECELGNIQSHVGIIQTKAAAGSTETLLYHHRHGAATGLAIKKFAFDFALFRTSRISPNTRSRRSEKC
jgi:hypothetical protein